MSILEAPARRAAEHQAGRRLELTEGEAGGVAGLAEDLAAMMPALIDDPGWLAHALRLSCRLPIRLRESARAYRHDSGEAGVFVIGGLPLRADRLPDTPAVPESAERVASVPAALAVLLALQLGELVAYRQEKAGALVHNVVPVPGLERSQSNAGSVALKLHVENAFHPHRPDYVGLMCLRNDQLQGGGTLVASVRQALPLVEAADLEVLRSPGYITTVPPSFRSGDQTVSHGVLAGSDTDPDVCLDFNATVALDARAREAMDRLGRALAAVSRVLVLNPGEMAFIDNRIVLHGRTPFSPQYDGRDRWLHRVYVHLDNRRGNARRSPGSQALN